MQRPLTAAEIARLKAHPGVARARLSPGKTAVAVLKAMLWFELLLGLPVAMLFFAAAHWGHSEDVGTALGRAAFGTLVPPGLLVAGTIGTVLSRLVHPAQDWRAQVRREIAVGIGSVTTHRPIAAHPLLDGDNIAPHMLLRLAGDRWLCLCDLDWQVSLPAFAPTDTVTICALPKSRLMASLQFSGQPIAVLAPVHTDNLWRNDDLPFDKAVAMRSLPDRLRAQLYPD